MSKNSKARYFRIQSQIKMLKVETHYICALICYPTVCVRGLALWALWHLGGRGLCLGAEKTRSHAYAKCLHCVGRYRTAFQFCAIHDLRYLRWHRDSLTIIFISLPVHYRRNFILLHIELQIL